MARRRSAPAGLEHCPTGISGLDAITSGGLPRGRTTLVAGSAGCGKTLLSIEFLVRGVEMGEPGVFLAFEETADELSTNVATLGWDLEQLCADGQLVVDHVKVEREQEKIGLIYEIKILIGTGRVREVKIDARTGKVVKIEDD